MQTATIRIQTRNEALYERLKEAESEVLAGESLYRQFRKKGLVDPVADMLERGAKILLAEQEYPYRPKSIFDNILMNYAFQASQEEAVRFIWDLLDELERMP